MFLAASRSHSTLRSHALFLLAALLSFAGLGWGQNNPGTPSWSAYDVGQIDTINLQNLNLSLNIPVMSKSGAFALSASLVGGDSNVSFNTALGALVPGVTSFGPQAFIPIVNGMLSDSTLYSTQALAGSITYVVLCSGSGSTTKYSNWYLLMPDGTQHPLPPGDSVNVGGSCPTSFSDQVTDGTGWTVSINGATYNSLTQAGVSVVSSGGLTVVNDITPRYIQDAQSSPNKISVNSSNQITDTMGMQAFTMLTSGLNWTGLEWSETSGSMPEVTPSNYSNNLMTAYGCSGKPDSTTSGYSPLETLAFPDTSTIGFTWEGTPGNSGYITGKLSSFTLRGGGTVTYNWNPNNAAHDGLNCTYLVPTSLTRTTSDGTRTYTTSFTTSAPYVETVTKIDESGNKTVYTFTGFTATGASGVQALTEVQYYNYGGTVKGYPNYVLAETVIHCYNSATPTISSCSTATVSEPVREVDTYTQLAGMTTYARSQVQFDGGPSSSSPTYGNVTYSAQYDFAANPTTPTTTSTITYGSWNGASCAAVGSNINNKPCQVVNTLSGNTVGYSRYKYSSTGNVLVSYVSPNGGSTFLSNPTANAYNSNGTLSTSYDFAGNATTYAYLSGSYSGGCSGVTHYPFATSITKNGLTTKATYNCYGAVKLSDSDANTPPNTTNYTYSDPWNRVGTITDPNGNVVTKSYSATSLV